jgi:DNA-binding response OmpR family regulator
MKTIKTRILLVEDDPNLGQILAESLELQGFQVTLCQDGEEGENTFFKHPFDLCLIDVMLPKKDGFSLAKDIRKGSTAVPIIFLTAKSMKEDRIQGFKIGGDDYITKPFNMEELVLRIKAVLKRSGLKPEEENIHDCFPVGEYMFDYSKRCLSRKKSHRILTHREADLLRLLCLHKNQILERSLALKIIWENDNFFSARSMDVYISKLRKYLENDPRIKIENIHGRGFKLNLG